MPCAGSRRMGSTGLGRCTWTLGGGEGGLAASVSKEAAEAKGAEGEGEGEGEAGGAEGDES